MPTQIQLRRDTAANWTAANTILAEGEIGYETDTDQFKIGDGTTAWNDFSAYYLKAADGLAGFDENGLSTNTLRLWNENFVNFQTASTTLAIGDNHPQWGGTIYRDIAQPAWKPHYAIDVEPVVTLHQTSPMVGIFSQPVARVVAGVNSSVTGVSGTVQSYGNKVGAYTGNLTMKGVEGTAYVRSQNETAAYGGYFDTFTGGNGGAANSTPLYGIFARVSGGHNGTSPSATASKFEVYNLGGGGAGTITNAIGSEIIINGSGSTTNFGTAKGLAIQGWSPASGTFWNNSYGIYIDNTIDQGSTRYAIYSLSTSDSLFSGPVRGPLNAYDATNWNGSTKFATEDAVRDKIEALILASDLTGTGTTNCITYFTGPTTVASLPAIYTSNIFKFYRNTVNDAFRIELRPSSTGDGIIQLGNQDDGTNVIYMEQAGNLINVAAANVELGDAQGVSNGTSLQIDDVSRRFTFWGSTSASEIDADNIYRWKFLRTLTTAGTTGAVTINRPYGSVNFAAAATTLVVTNSVATATSLIFVTPQTADATATSFSVTRAAGSFTITANAAATAETTVAFYVSN